MLHRSGLPIALQFLDGNRFKLTAPAPRISSQAEVILVPLLFCKRTGCLDELWLENIQQPTEVERLLGTFAPRSCLVPPTACRLRDRKALPEKLQRLLTEAIDHAWLGFSEGSRFWLFTLWCPGHCRRSAMPLCCG